MLVCICIFRIIYAEQTIEAILACIRACTRTESHLEYLQSRGISPEIVKRYEVVSGKVWNGERELDALVIPYKRDGELPDVD
ncbi:hypothetical protein GAJ30_16375 [Escherichia coli]|nr:hypothetical protein [Escherichia coli]EFB3785854.1 hypothetical protein [Escherichia coli]